jgi:hypothetical protein
MGNLTVLVMVTHKHMWGMEVRLLDTDCRSVVSLTPRSFFKRGGEMDFQRR